MDVTYINTILVAIFVTGTSIVKSSIILQDSAMNVSTLELVNNLVDKLINPSVLINAASTSTTPGVVEEPTSSSTTGQVSSTESSERQGGFLGFWDHGTIRENTDRRTESQDQEDESEEDSISTDELQNDISFDVSKSYHLPSYYFSIKAGHKNPFIVEDHVLQMHLNETIERLREFNDKYERLMMENEAINKNLEELKNNFPPRYQDRNDTRGMTAAEQQPSETRNAIPISSNDTDIINGIRANLLV